MAAMLDSALKLNMTGALPVYADQLSRGAYALAEALDDLETAERRVAELEIDAQEAGRSEPGLVVGDFLDWAADNLPGFTLPGMSITDVVRKYRAEALYAPVEDAQEQRAETKRKVRGEH